MHKTIITVTMTLITSPRQRLKPLPSIGYCVSEAVPSVSMIPPALSATWRDGSCNECLSEPPSCQLLSDRATHSQATHSTLHGGIEHTEQSTELVRATSRETIEETPPSCQYSVTLCLRLPDGSRAQRRFDYKTDTLLSVVLFGLQPTGVHGPTLSDDEITEDQVELSTCTIPKTVHRNLSLTLEEVGLVHNTVLCLNVL